MSYLKIPILTTQLFFKNRYSYRASALAFTTLLSMVPLLAVLVFFVGLFPEFSNLMSLSQQYILSNFLPSTAAAIEKYLQGFLLQTVRLPIFSILFLGITALLLINTVEETFDDIWKPKNRRKKWIALFFYFLFIFLSPLIMGISVFFTFYFFSLSWISVATTILKIKAFIAFCLPILINTLLLTLFYIVVPSTKVKWRYGIIGGFVAALGCEALRIGFAYYIAYFPTYDVIYGTFAIIPIFLLWLYFLWVIILWCALFTCVLQSRH